MDIVVGSGPAGLAVATALLARGRSVTMVDGGRTLPADADARRTEMAAIPATDWSADQIDAWREPQFSPQSPLVHRYGSDHAQEALSETLSDAPDWFAARASHAVGGLSNVWGAAVLPNRAADIAAWPITIEDLKPHYQAVADLVPIAGRVDPLESLFPVLPMTDRQPLRSGPQGEKLLTKLDEKADRLRAMGVHAGQARQAVGSDCQYCGLCLHGCPWQQIYSGNQSLETLKAQKRFTHMPGRLVRSFRENSRGVVLQLADGETLKGARVFIGAGVLETARIVLSSQPTGGRVTLRDSRHFFLPLLHAWSPDADPETAPHHTLTEAFIEIDSPEVSPYLTHTQIYGWNAFFAREMVANYGSKLPGSQPIFERLARRLMVAQTFLHSDHCDTIELSLTPGADKLDARLIENEHTVKIMRAARKKLAKALRQAGLYALSFASRLDAPGASFHSGGTFPMSDFPDPLQTDELGRLPGLKRVHLVDASVLPTIPATTITLSVMANAHRIGATS